MEALHVQSVSSARFVTHPPTDACGLVTSRHLVASWNIAKDGARYVPADCWQMQRVAEWPVATAKLPVEPEKIPVQAGVQFDTEF